MSELLAWVTSFGVAVVGLLGVSSVALGVYGVGDVVSTGADPGVPRVRFWVLAVGLILFGAALASFAVWYFTGGGS